MGYHRAGFDVTGVDVVPQPNYPFPFVQADAMTYPLYGFDAIHASPPCHDHSNVTGKDRNASGAKGTGWMLEATIDRLNAPEGIPFVVENVESAKMPTSVVVVRLCGSSFGLDLRRHRKFATNVSILVPPCAHAWQTPRFKSLHTSNPKLASVVGVHGNLQYAGEFPLRCAAMGVDWMTNAELCQAIPPAYTEYIGEQLLQVVTG